MRAAQLRLTADMRVYFTPSFVTFRFVRFDIFVSNLIQLRPLSLASDYRYLWIPPSIRFADLSNAKANY